MLSDAQRDQLKPIARTMQIIVGALCLGVLSFLIVVLVIGSAKPQDQDSEPFLTYLAVGMAVGAIVVSIFLPSIILRSSPANTANPVVDDARLVGANGMASENIGRFAQLYQTQLIIRCAILEGAAFFCLVGYMIEQQMFGLVAAVVLLLVMLANFPTRSRVESWIDARLIEKEQLQQLG